MAKETRQPFTPFLGKLIARKWFTFDGKDYFPGDVFPWGRLGVPQRKLRQMYEAGRLRPEEGTVPQPAKEKKAPPVKEKETPPQEKKPTPKQAEKKKEKKSPPTPKRTPKRGRKENAEKQGGGKKKKKSRKRTR